MVGKLFTWSLGTRRLMDVAMLIVGQISTDLMSVFIIWWSRQRQRQRQRVTRMAMRTCDDVERVGGGGEGGRGGNGERGVANHWHRVTPGCCLGLLLLFVFYCYYDCFSLLLSLLLLIVVIDCYYWLLLWFLLLLFKLWLLLSLAPSDAWLLWGLLGLWYDMILMIRDHWHGVTPDCYHCYDYVEEKRRLKIMTMILTIGSHYGRPPRYWESERSQGSHAKKCNEEFSSDICHQKLSFLLHH